MVWLELLAPIEWSGAYVVLGRRYAVSIRIGAIAAKTDDALTAMARRTGATIRCARQSDHAMEDAASRGGRRDVRSPQFVDKELPVPARLFAEFGFRGHEGPLFGFSEPLDLIFSCAGRSF
jgi:hypothetical protein